MLRQKSKKDLSASDSKDSRSSDYARYKELTSKSKASQKEVDQLADEINKNWWSKNRKRFIK